MTFVSIRAPREGGDSEGDMSFDILEVSIRAPREGGDSLHSDDCHIRYGFNPRPP